MGYAFGLVPFASAGVGAPHIRERAYWVANASSEYESTARDETGIAARLRSCAIDGMADAGCERLNRVDALLQREESGRVTKSVPEVAGLSVTGGLGYADHSRLERHIRDDSAAGRERASGSVTAPGLHSRALEVNGFWRDADWIFCRDGQSRPVEPGTFPLVARFAKSMGHGKSSLRAMAGRNRTGRLKGYGNAINAQAAAEFVKAYIQIMEPA